MEHLEHSQAFADTFGNSNRRTETWQSSLVPYSLIRIDWWAYKNRACARLQWIISIENQLRWRCVCLLFENVGALSSDRNQNRNQNPNWIPNNNCSKSWAELISSWLLKRKNNEFRFESFEWKIENFKSIRFRNNVQHSILTITDDLTRRREHIERTVTEKNFLDFGYQLANICVNKKCVVCESVGFSKSNHKNRNGKKTKKFRNVQICISWAVQWIIIIIIIIA